MSNKITIIDTCYHCKQKVSEGTGSIQEGKLTCSKCNKKPIETNNIYWEDCMEGMKRIPEKTIDLVIVDPPYNNLSYKGGGGIMEFKKKAYLHKIAIQGMTEFDPKPFLKEIQRILKHFHAYIFCNKEMFVDYITFFNENNYNWNLLIMGKNNPLPSINNTYAPDTEYIFFVREKNSCHWTPHLPFNYYKKIKMVNIGDKETTHPTEKPVKLIKELLEVSSKEGDIILDCFMGSGTTAIACKQLKRKYIGFEKNKEYIEIIEKRLKETYQEGGLKKWVESL